MKLLWHMARRDLRHFWIPVGFLAASKALEFLIGSRLLRDSGSDIAAFERLAIYATVLWAAGLVITYLMTAIVVHEDPLAGPAAWRTRPVSRAQLMGAKFLGLFLMLGVVPVLVSLPWWWALGFNATEAGQAALATLEVQMAVVLLALPWAVLTDGMGRFLMCSLTGGVLALTSALLLAEYSGTLVAAGYWVNASRLVIILALGGMGIMAVTVNQYLSGRRWRSVGLGLVAAAALEAATFGWRWDEPALWAFRPREAAARAPQVQAAVEGASLVGGVDKNGAAALYVTVSLTGIPRDQLVGGVFAQQSITWADGSRVEQAFPEDPGWFSNLGAIARTLSVKPSADTLWEWNERWARRSLLPRQYLGTVNVSEAPIRLPAKEVRKILTEPAAYKATAWFRLYRTVVVGERLAADDSRFDRGSTRGRISAAATGSEDRILRISVRESRPALHRPEFFGLTAANLHSHWRYYLVNASRSNLLEEREDGESRPVVIGNVEIQMRNLVFPPNLGLLPTGSTIRREPPMDLADATVAAVGTPEVERFSRTLEASPLAVLQARDGAATPKLLISVRGEVRMPKESVGFRHPTVLKALRYSGGLTDEADAGHVTIVRTDPAGQVSRIVVDVEAFLQSGDSTAVDQPLRSGDIIEVPRRE